MELVEQRDYFGNSEPVISQPLSDRGPIFLFYMGIVVFMICSAAGSPYGTFCLGEVAQEMIGEDFAAIVAIQAA